MPTTPTYLWPTPADTDYVKDGAAAIRTLGDAIDAELAGHDHGSNLAGYRETVTAPGDSGTVTLDLSVANVFDITPTGAITIALTNASAAGTFTPVTIRVNNSTYAITWPAGTQFPAGTAPELSGETWLSGVVDASGVLHVGVAWKAVA